ADGAVSPVGIAVGGQTVGVGDEVVTCRNDRQLVTTTGHWVRNGDRWTVTAHTDDGGLTVSSLAGHGHAHLLGGYVHEHVRLADGAVSPVGIAVGGQTVGVGDEVVTCRNDRQLVTTTGHWVRNGDRWTVTAHTDDGGLTVSSLAGHGHAHLLGGYVHEHVRLA